MKKRKTVNTVGIMSGTSLDGIDFVLCKCVETGEIKYVDKVSVKFPSGLREKLLLAAEHDMNVAELSELNHELGKIYASQLKSIAKKKNWKVHLVGLHGQTVHHKGGSATLQIGEPSYLATEIEVPVVSDFRALDIAYGGQGAPIATDFHETVFRKNSNPVAIQNIGGIGNVSYFYKNKALSFDTGPGNMLMDTFIQEYTVEKKRFDENGKFAKTGLADLKIVEKWLSDKVFSKKPPRSFGREEFGQKFYERALIDMKDLSDADKAATFTELTAQSIRDAYIRFLPKFPEEIVICGGGARNSYLIHRLRYLMPESEIAISNNHGWPEDAVEGGAFALLAAKRYWHQKSSIPSTTGARKRASLGKLTLP